MKPTLAPNAALSTAISPAQSGVEALVPLPRVGIPFTKMPFIPLLKLALPETSGTPRPTWPSMREGGTPTPTGYGGSQQRWSLTPHPVVPQSDRPDGSFQTYSSNVEPIIFPTVVPPTPRDQGSLAG